MASCIIDYMILVLALVNIHFIGVKGLLCLSCIDTVAPVDCDTIQQCGSHESCFIEASVLDNGHVRYQMGCRDTQQCTTSQQHAGRRESRVMNSAQFILNSSLQLLNASQMPSLLNNSTFAKIKIQNCTSDIERKRSPDLLVCSECCTKDLCNSAGCGHNGYVSPKGPVCFHCSQQMTPDDCNRIAICGVDQVCALYKTQSQTTHEIRYQTRCEGETVCRNKERASALIMGRRQLSGASCSVHCCTADLCNLQCSSTSGVASVTQTNQLPTSNSAGIVTTILPYDPCFSNPCMRGTCSAYQNTYRCSCETGYWGQQCDQVVVPTAHTATQTPDPCLSNPCIYGQCSPVLSSYKCTCEHGHWGRNCEKGTSITAQCPSGWIRFDNSCYYFSHGVSTWLSAQVICQTFGGYLACLNSYTEEHYLQYEVEQRGGNFWVGGNDLLVKGVYTWVSGEPMNYNNWMPGEPNDKEGHENCIDLRADPRYNLGWNDEDCDIPQRYICERPNSNATIG